jgi:hypothetical protein
MKRYRRLLGGALAVTLLLLGGGSAPAQQQADPSGPAVPLTVLVDQIVDLFPKVQGEVIEVRDADVTLGVGRRDGVQPGLELEVFREGREIKHPRTGQVLGTAEQALGRVVVAEVQEAFSIAKLMQGGEVKPGDRFRLSAAKIKLTLLPLAGGVRESLVEAAIHELVERLNGSGRFQVVMGDVINVHLAQQGIKPEELLQGKGVKEAAERFKVEHLLAIHFTRVQNRPYMDVRFFSPPRPEPAVTTAFFVPPSIRTVPPGGRFSTSGRDRNPPQARPRSLLARLLGGDLEAGSYSTGESSIPLREVVRFPFPVLAMDVAVTPKDKLPRIAASDGEKVYQYRVVNQKLEPEWTFSARSLGRVISVQFVDLDDDGVLEVIGTRYHPKVGVTSFAVQARDLKPRYLVDDLSDFLFAVDTKGAGVKQTLWIQRYSPDKFFTEGQVDEARIKDGKLVIERPVRVPSAFRPMGAAFSNINGKDSRALAYVDRSNRLQIIADGQELWRSSTSVGGGYMTIEHEVYDIRGGRSFFYKIEPTPLAVDLDGDGIDEIVVPQNLVREGMLAVVFRGPAGFRLQSIDSGFEGGITALGAYKTEESIQPTLIISVVRFSNLLRTSGETQLIMTVPQD